MMMEKYIRLNFEEHDFVGNLNNPQKGKRRHSKDDALYMIRPK